MAVIVEVERGETQRGGALALGDKSGSPTRLNCPLDKSKSCKRRRRKKKKGGGILMILSSNLIFSLNIRAE